MSQLYFGHSKNICDVPHVSCYNARNMIKTLSAGDTPAWEPLALHHFVNGPVLGRDMGGEFRLFIRSNQHSGDHCGAFDLSTGNFYSDVLFYGYEVAPKGFKMQVEISNE